MDDDREPVTCALCAVYPRDGGDRLTWVRDGDRWLCPGCARRHVRDIEARLDPEWWG